MRNSPCLPEYSGTVKVSGATTMICISNTLKGRYRLLRLVLCIMLMVGVPGVLDATAPELEAHAGRSPAVQRLAPRDSLLHTDRGWGARHRMLVSVLMIP